MPKTDVITMHAKNLKRETARQKTSRFLYEFLIYAFLILMAAIVLFPFYWMIISSVKSLEL